MAAAMEADPKGWLDISPGSNLEGWTEFPWFTYDPPQPPSQWHMDRETGILLCDGKGPHSRFLTDREYADFIYHVEWRFTPGQTFYNSGVFVRMQLDQPNKMVMYQAEMGETPGRFGFFNGGMLVGDRLMRVEQRILKDGKWRAVHPHFPAEWKQSVKCIAPPSDPDFWDASSAYDVGTSGKINPPGEWNTYEITCRRKVLSIWANGSVTSVCDSCPVPSGRLGLEAEYFRVEFRNIRLKEL